MAHDHFEAGVLLLILISSLALMFENPVDAARPLPVARGAARVAARKGISVGMNSRSELKQLAREQREVCASPDAEYGLISSH